MQQAGVEHARIRAKYAKFCREHGFEPKSTNEIALKLRRKPQQIDNILELWIDAFPDKLIEIHKSEELESKEQDIRGE